MKNMYQPLPYSEATGFTNFWQKIKEILSYLVSSQLQERIIVIKIVFIVISVLFIILIVYFLAKTEFLKWWFLNFLKNFLFPKIVRKKWIDRKWKKVKRNLEKGRVESEWKVSIIRGLNIFEEILKEMGYPGKNLMERVSKLNKEDVSNFDELIKTVQACQDLVRDPDYKLSKEEAQNILENFEKTLVDLEVL